MLAAVDHAARMIRSELGDALAVGFGASATVAGAVMAAADGIDTGVVVGAAGLLVFLFRYWFSETKRKDQGVWEIADEYRVERDYERGRADHWQARWGNLVRGRPEMEEVPPMPNLDAMRADAQRDKEADRGRRH